ncbi:hypothetical protein [Ferrovibrio sp.]|uniref:hypothetical protein n=1 Tax=Ferrovibrio sp. TaxID=1917215 RepID=UPI003D27B95A
MTRNTFILAISLSTICAFLYGLNFSVPVVERIMEGFQKELVSFFGTLIGAGATVCASILGAKYQIKKSQESAEAQKQRELTAARAILASDLSTMISYLEQSVRIITLIVRAIEQGEERQEVDCPTLSFEVMLRIANLVALKPAGDIGVLTKLLHDIQVQTARLTSEVDAYNGRHGGPRYGIRVQPHHFDPAIMITISLHIQAVNLFDYARFQTDSISTAIFNEQTFNDTINIIGLREFPDSRMVDRVRRGVVRRN